jgi:hypothetical protein
MCSIGKLVYIGRNLDTSVNITCDHQKALKIAPKNFQSINQIDEKGFPFPHKWFSHDLFAFCTLRHFPVMSLYLSHIIMIVIEQKLMGRKP